MFELNRYNLASFRESYQETVVPGMGGNRLNQEEPAYIAIDLKSFYASVECRERGLDPMTTNLVVADKRPAWPSHPL